MNIGFIIPEKVQNITGVRALTKGTINKVCEIDNKNRYSLFEDDYIDSGARTLPLVRTSNSELMQRQYDFLCYCNKIDVVHSFWNSMENMRSPAAKIITIYDLVPLIYPEWHTMYDYFDSSIRKTATIADHIVAISEHTKKDIIKYYNIRAEKVKVVYPGFKTELKIDMDNWIEVIKKWQLDNDGYILSVSTLEPRKNLRRLIQGYIEYRRSDLYSTEKLVLAGELGWDDEFYSYINELGDYKKDIILTGYVSNMELSALYKGARGVAYVSCYEGFGLPILEALNFGKAVLSSNTSSMPEVGGDAVVYCDPYSIENIAEGIQKITRDDNIRHEIISRAKAQTSKFSYNKAAKEHISLYEKYIL